MIEIHLSIFLLSLFLQAVSEWTERGVCVGVSSTVCRQSVCTDRYGGVSASEFGKFNVAAFR